ncbi:MAG: polysaccharide biosynthesis tyrosine autokinase [Hyphomicrobiales bacterium]|nr:polysaccharide biosynthesis tyrosine autokinase [Hyphomicrobiales bacterium]
MNLPAMDAQAGGAAGGALAEAPAARLAPAQIDQFRLDARSSGLSPFQRYLVALQKHMRFVIGAAIVSLLVGAFITLLMPRIYTATTSLQIDREAAKVLRSQEMSVENPSDPQFYSTQYELLRSRALAERVMNSLGLANRKDFGAAEPSGLRLFWERLFSHQDEAKTEVERRQRRTIDILMKNLYVQPVPMSRIVKLSYSNRSPQLARDISASFADNFVAMTLDRRYSASSYARGFLEEKLQQVKLKLEESEKQVVAYAQKEGIVNVDDKISVTGANLKALNESLAEATADRIKNAQLWTQAQIDNGAGLPQVMNDKVIETAREKRAQLMAEYQDKLRLMKPDFPEMRQTRAQIVEYDKQIARQIDLVKRSIKSQYDASRDQEASLQHKIDALKAETLDLRNRSIQYNILQREVDTNRSLYDGLLQQYKEVGVTGALSTNNVSIVDKAELPAQPSSPSYLLNLPLALLVGLLGSAGWIAAREILDDTFKSPEEVEEFLGMPALGVIPLNKASARKKGKGLDDDKDDAKDKKSSAKVESRKHLAREIVDNPLSPLAEAYRSLRTALQFSTPHGAPKVLLVTSSQPGEGKSTTSLCLAANFGQLGMRVLLIDADLRKASLHKTLGLSNNIGLSNVLTGTLETSKSVRENVLNGVTFMASGPIPPNPAELLAGPQMSSMLAVAREIFDIVIIDGPPTMGLADAPLLGNLADGALIVVDAGHTRRRTVAAAVKRLYFARTHMVGVLLNKFDARKAGQTYGYGYGYGGLDYFDYGSKLHSEKKPSIAKS